MLESFCHDDNCFVTLTYETMPENASLNPEHHRNFLKRLRKSLAARQLPKVRFYAVGEYGSETQRPHYHYSLFGLSVSMGLRLVPAAWPNGFTMTAEFNKNTAAYVCGYVTKKMTSKHDPRLNGRYPEFARQSNRPGIGHSAMAVIRDVICTDAGLDEYLATGDVPMTLKMGKKSLPLGRYLRDVLREEIGVSDAERQTQKQKYTTESSTLVCLLLQDSIARKEALSSSGVLALEALGRTRNIEARHRIQMSRGQKL